MEKKSLSNSMEDYLEAVFLICNRKGYARAGDIAEKMRVSGPSVTEMMKKLSEMGYISYKDHGVATLTEKGRKIAVAVRNRHTILKNFLQIIGVSENNAEIDACRLEHVLSDTALEKISRIVSFLQQKHIIEEYRAFIKKVPCE